MAKLPHIAGPFALFTGLERSVREDVSHIQQARAQSHQWWR